MLRVSKPSTKPMIARLFQRLLPSTPTSNTGSHRQRPQSKGFACKDIEKCNGGKNIIEGHPDYIVLCGHISSLSLLEASVFAAFGTRFDWGAARPGTNGKFYESNVRGANGLMLSLNTSSNGGEIEYRLSIPGLPLRHIKRQKLHDFGQFFVSINARCTRFDWAVDDYSRTLDIDTLYLECLDGNRHGFGEITYYVNGKRGQKALGKTLYLGAFDTHYLARIYDKCVESKGEMDCIRFEVQTSGEVSVSFFNHYFGIDDISRATRELSQRAIGKYRFVERTSEVLSRCPDLPWWADFVAKVGGQIKVSVPRVQPMISDKKRWVESQVCGTIGLIFECMGIKQGAEWLLAEIRKSMNRNRAKNIKYKQTLKGRIYADSQGFESCVSEFLEAIEFQDLQASINRMEQARVVSLSPTKYRVPIFFTVDLHREIGVPRQLGLFS